MRYRFNAGYPVRYTALVLGAAGFLLGAFMLFDAGRGLLALLLFGVLCGVGIHDVLQTKSSILRNHPVMGHLRFLLEFILPEVRRLSNLVLHVKEGSLLTDLDSQHRVFRLYWPLASAHSFAVSKPRDKVSSTGEEEPAAAVVPA